MLLLTTNTLEDSFNGWDITKMTVLYVHLQAKSAITTGIHVWESSLQDSISYTDSTQGY